MEDNRLKKYLDEIGSEQQLTAEEERELSARILSGDKQAQQKLVVANIKLVVSVANGYQGRGLSIDDLVSEGNMGLLRAAERYDGSRGARFSSYAVPLIRQHIERALTEENRKTMGRQTPFGNERALTGNEQKEDSGEWNGKSGVKVRSVDAPLGAKPNMSLLSVLVDGNSPLADEDVLQTDSLEAYEQALASLNERERYVVKAFFGIGQEAQTMAEIGMDMGLKRERVRQIRDRAVRRLRKGVRG